MKGTVLGIHSFQCSDGEIFTSYSRFTGVECQGRFYRKEMVKDNIRHSNQIKLSSEGATHGSLCTEYVSFVFLEWLKKHNYY